MGWREGSKFSLDTHIMRYMPINLEFNRFLNKPRNCRV